MTTRRLFACTLFASLAGSGAQIALSDDTTFQVEALAVSASTVFAQGAMRSDRTHADGSSTETHQE